MFSVKKYCDLRRIVKLFMDMTLCISPITLQAHERVSTYSELECVFLSMWPEAVLPLRGSLGEEGSDESVISSMSEWEEADLGDFFLLNACLKELRSCRKKTEEKRETVSRGGSHTHTETHCSEEEEDCAGESGGKQL